MRYKSEMTPDDIIRMAREAGWQYADGDDGYKPLWRFAALVSAAERERVTFELVNEAQRAVQEAVWAEREACAVVCENDPVGDDPACCTTTAYRIARRVRARGEK